jgi:hypothetical protein
MVGGVPEFSIELIRDCRFNLKELMDVASGSDYGRLFTEAAAGGIDLIQLAESLGMGRRGSPRPIDRRNLAQLQRELVAAENMVANCSDQKMELSRLESERERLKVQVDRLRLLNSATRHRSALNELEEALRRLGDFPPSLEQLHGGEWEQIDDSQKQILNEKEELVRAREDWRCAIRNRRESGLAGEIGAGLITFLERSTTALAGLEQRLQTAEAGLSEASSRMWEAHNLLGGQVPEDLLKAADANLLMRLEEWCDRVEEHQGRAAAVDELEKDLDDLSPGPATGVATDIQLLRDWLAADRAEELARKQGPTLIVLALVILGGSLACGILWHPAGFLGSLGGVGLFVAWLLSCRGRAKEFRREAEERGQPSPEAWSRQPVNRLLEQLEMQHAEELEKRQRITRWSKVLATRKSEIEEEGQMLERDAEDLSHDLGFIPGLGPKCFGMLAEAWKDWQGAFRSASAASEMAERIKAQVDELRDPIMAKLRNFEMLGLRTEFTAADLAGWVAELRDRDQRFQNARRDLEVSRAAVSRGIRVIRQNRKMIEDIYSKVDLKPTEEAAFLELLESLPAYRETREEVSGYRHAEREAKEFFGGDPDLALMSLDVLVNEVEGIGNAADLLNGVNQEIGAMTERLRTVRRSTKVEAKRTEYENRQADLQTEREKMLASVAGMSLAERVQKKVVSETVPQVQLRAGELLKEFTRGTCELFVEDGCVRALQPGEGSSPFDLNELSDGTRVQLFVAVRVAFVEQGEGNYCLPLFFDEALANSDDHRGNAMMQALIEISKQGRQVFCFTSQASEFSRWSDLLAEAEEGEAKLTTLQAAFGPPEVRAALNVPRRYPEPSEGESMRDYAERIGAWRPMDPWIASVDEVPLVHVLDDPRDLHVFMEASVHTWGPLERLGAEKCGLTNGSGAFDKARLGAMFLHGVASLWQQGRGLPVTRQQLEEAGVTNTQTASRLDETWDHAERLGRDAGRLCKALESGDIAVARLGPALIRQLREFCEEQGLIALEEPINEGELRLRAGSLARSLGLDDEESARLLDAFTVQGNE